MAKTLMQLFQPKQPSATTDATVTYSPDSKDAAETYVYYGTRICGKVTASLPALQAFLPKIYNDEKQRQINDRQLQENHKQSLSNQLMQTESRISAKNTLIENIEEKINQGKEKLAELKANLIEAKDKNGDLNKAAKVKLILGLVILAILTIYLFIFYSSTFYSAFFKSFTSEISVGAAMFDAQAIPNSFANGFGQLLFIMCAPIIFMGLGYGLHFFSMQRNWTKYLKIFCIVAITFVFDCILAYLIAKKIYDIEVLTKLGTFPEFNLDMAISDVNVWAVIFCGFIVYIIWGIVFGMTLSAYEDLRSNKKEIDQLATAIDNQQKHLTAEKDRLTNEKMALSNLTNQRKQLESEMNRTVHFDLTVIKRAMADFHSGWMTMMNTLRRTDSEQEQANRIFQEITTQLFS